MSPIHFELIPPALRARPQWLVWRLEDRKGKPSKVPYSARSGSLGKSNDPATWCDFNRAGQAARRGDYDGVGFAFAAGDGIFGVDLDKCISDEGELEPWANEVLERFLDTYIEISPSMRGLRIFGYGAPTRCGKGTDEKRIELYDHTSPRYLTVTGSHWIGSAPDLVDCSAQLEWLHQRFFFPRSEVKADSPNPLASPKTNTPQPLPLSDSELLDKACRNAQFAKLFGGQWEGDYPSQSEADAALCARLAFWCAGDVARMDRMFRASRLMRPKWDRRHHSDGRTYGSATVERAAAKCTEHYQPRAERARPAPVASGELPKASAGGGGSDGDEPPIAPPPPGDESDGRPIVRLRDGELVQVVDLAEMALFAGDAREPPLFQRGGALCRIQRIDGGVDGAVKRAAGAPILTDVPAPWLCEQFMRKARFQRWSKTSDKWQDKDLPERYSNVYLARSSWAAPSLRAIVEAPLMRPDGSILSAAGYDSASQVYFERVADFRIPPAKPSEDDVKWALDLFHDLFDPFSFEEPHDFAALVAAILTALMRPSLRLAPMFAIRAPVMGSGKTLLARLIGIIATGRDVSVISHPAGDENEFRKRLLATLVAGDPIIFIDNVDAPMKSEALCAVLTSDTWSERELSKSRNIRVMTNRTWLMTGNNLMVDGDLTRRVIPIDLNPNCAKPYDRKFDRDAAAHASQHRADFVLAGLMLLRSFAAAGKPDMGVRLGSFEEWSDWVRSAVLFAGLPDPCKGLEDWESTDSVRLQLTQLLTSWHEICGSTAMRASELVERAGNSMALTEVLSEVCGGRDGKFSPKRLGKFLSTYVGRIEAGFKIERSGVYQGTILYKVVPVDGH